MVHLQRLLTTPVMSEKQVTDEIVGLMEDRGAKVSIFELEHESGYLDCLPRVFGRITSMADVRQIRTTKKHTLKLAMVSNVFGPEMYAIIRTCRQFKSIMSVKFIIAERENAEHSAQTAFDSKQQAYNHYRDSKEGSAEIEYEQRSRATIMGTPDKDGTLWFGNIMAFQSHLEAVKGLHYSSATAWQGRRIPVIEWAHKATALRGYGIDHRKIEFPMRVEPQDYLGFDMWEIEHHGIKAYAIQKLEVNGTYGDPVFIMTQEHMSKVEDRREALEQLVEDIQRYCELDTEQRESHRHILKVTTRDGREVMIGDEVWVASEYDIVRGKIMLLETILSEVYVKIDVDGDEDTRSPNQIVKIV